MKLKFVDREWGCQGADHWQIFGNTTRHMSSCGYFDKFAHLIGHCSAVLLARYWLGLPLWLLILGSVMWSICYEVFWDNLAEGSGVSKYDLIANNIGMLLGVLIILTSQLIHRLQISRSSILIIIVMGFVLVFAYKIVKLKRR